MTDMTEQEAMDGSPAVVNLGAPDMTYDRDRPRDFGFIRFQCGPVPTNGVNGTTIENVIQVLIDRLEGFQRGPFACDENAAAISYLVAAQEALDLRTRRRLVQYVEGTNEPHASYDRDPLPRRDDQGVQGGAADLSAAVVGDDSAASE